MNKLVFRQMLHGTGATVAITQMKKEGIRYLYRGILPPLYYKSFYVSVAFGIFETTRQTLTDLGASKATAQMVSGSVAGIFESLLTPLERIQVLLMDPKYNVHVKNTNAAFRMVVKGHGVKELYRGYSMTIVRNIIGTSLYFGARRLIEDNGPAIESKFGKSLLHFATGSLTGVGVTFLIQPINTARVVEQSKLGGDFIYLLRAVKNVYVSRGSKMRHLYHGLMANCMRAFMSWGVLNLSYEHIRKFIYKL